MDFEWDEKKRLVNLRKHGFDFRDGPHLFNGPLLTWLDVRFDYGEPITTGFWTDVSWWRSMRKHRTPSA